MSMTAPKMFFRVSWEAKAIPMPPAASRPRIDFEVSASTIEMALTPPTSTTASLMTVEIIGTSTSSSLFSVWSASFCPQAIAIETRWKTVVVCARERSSSMAMAAPLS